VCPGGKGKQKKKPKYWEYWASVEAISSRTAWHTPRRGEFFFSRFFFDNIDFLIERFVEHNCIALFLIL
jgi:hypothetical protein